MEFRSYNEKKIDDIPFGIAKKDLKEGECIEILFINGKLYSDKIAFFEHTPYLSLLSGNDDKI